MKGKERTKDIEEDQIPMPAPPARVGTGKYYLLLLAVDCYTPFIHLDNPVRDANNLLKVLLEEYTFDRPEKWTDLRNTSPQEYDDYPEPIYVYDDVAVTCLYNENMTKTHIERALRRIGEVITKDDSLLVFFSGHGIHYDYDDIFYVLPAGATKDNREPWIDVQELVRPVSRWKVGPSEERRCKDYLLILDCCYAEHASFGGTTNSIGDFSRHVLTSSQAEAPASDGEPRTGSPFANVLIQYLAANEKTYVKFDKGEFGKLDGRFFARYEYLQQRLTYSSLPSENGRSFFVFERREKNKPALQHFIQSVFLHLNYHVQRGQVESSYDVELDPLSIFTTQGETLAVQRLLLKIVLLQIYKSSPHFWDTCTLIPPFPISRINMVDDLWRVLLRNMASLGQVDTMQKEEALEWLYAKLLTYTPGMAKPHVIVMFTLEAQGTKASGVIKDFVLDFYAVFQRRWQQTPDEEKDTMGKLYVIFADQRAGLKPMSYTEVYADLKDMARAFNFVETAPVGHLSHVDVNNWLKMFAADNTSAAVANLTNRATFEKLMGARQFKKTVEEFMECMCRHCEYSLEEKSRLIKALYEFNS